jgi:alpha-beta hydrolase superfamily lysophospholipase
MGADYLNQIKAHQPNGPYCLCGYSFGGLVAFEIARRLAESGDEVAFVGLFDALMSPLRWPPRAWLSIMGRRVARFRGSWRVAARDDDASPSGTTTPLADPRGQGRRACTGRVGKVSPRGLSRAAHSLQP